MAKERLSRARFIKLGAALGVGAASASVVAACGGGEGGDGVAGVEATDRGATGGVEGAPQAPGEAAGGENGRQQGGGEGAIASEADVPVGTAVEFSEGGRPAVLVHLENGDFAAYSAVCTHQGCTVAYQNQTGLIACPCHGSVFDPANGGAVVNPPAQTPLPGIPVEVRNGEVFRA